MVNLATVGKIGTVFYGLFSILCIVRTYQIWNVVKNPRQLKFLFHLVLTTCAVFDLIFSASLLSNKYVIWGYIFHLISGYAYLLAYTLVLYLWGKTFGHNAVISNRSCYAIGIINLFFTVVAIIAISVAGSWHTYKTKYFFVNISLFVVFSLSFVALTSGMIWYGISLLRQLQTSVVLLRPSTTNRPSNSPTSSMSARLTGVPSSIGAGGVGGIDHTRQDTRKRIGIIFRVNLVLLGCNLCFSLRVLALITNAIMQMMGRDLQFPPGVAGWFMISNWIPTLIPGVILLYIMRVKPPQRMKFRVDLSSAPSGIDNPLYPESTQLSYRDSKRSTSHIASTQRVHLFQESTSSTPGDGSAKSSLERHLDDQSSEELIIDEEVPAVMRASVDSFLPHNLRSFEASS